MNPDRQVTPRFKTPRETKRRKARDARPGMSAEYLAIIRRLPSWFDGRHKMSTENYLRELRWKEINALRAEVEDWKDNYNKATDACVALRAENARLRERLRFDDEEPYAHIDSLQAENAKLREALTDIVSVMDNSERTPEEMRLMEIARTALQKEKS